MRPKITPEYLKAQGFSETLPERFWAKVNKDGPIPDPIKYPDLIGCCWIWTASKDGRGYGMIGRGGVGGSGNLAKSHRVSWILNRGPIPIGLHVLHHCDMTCCIRPSHLWLGTPKDNGMDCVKKGRKNPKCGESNGLSVLTTEQVLEIRSLYPSVSGRELARRFCITQASMWAVINRRTWKHI